MSQNKRNSKSKIEQKKYVNTRKPIDSHSIEGREKNYHLCFLFAIICILPLIVKYITYETKLSEYPWFSDAVYMDDFFLIYKQRFFLIIAVCLFVYIIYALISKRNYIKDSRIFIPLAVYAVLAILSTLFSKYISYCLSGSYELFESVFVLLGYCVAGYYAYLVLNNEHDFKYIYYFIVILSLIMGVLGTFQFLGYDFFNSELAKKLILPIELRGNDITMKFGKKVVYLTLYNPNYVGVLGSLLIPVILIMTLMYRRVLWTILSILALIGLSISVVGSGSLTGVIGIGAALISIIILLWRYLFKYYYITISIVVVLVILAFFANKASDNYYINKLKAAINITKTEHALSSIETKDDRIIVVYNGNQMNVGYAVNLDNTVHIIAYDQEYNNIETTFDADAGVYTVVDERFNGITFGFDEEIDGVFYINIEGKKWRFTNLTEDKTYYYISPFYKLDKIVNPSAVFRGYEKFASARGYIWSRSIPLLKNTLLLGTGPDTFTLVFPQNDYLGFYQNLTETSILTKPHNIYIQIGVQTGVLSLLAFIAFYLLYFISSVRLYIRSRFTSFYSRFGLAIFVGTIGYMTSGLAYDSSITTAPVFWVLIGAGIAVNQKAKPLILMEIAEIKEQKARNMADKNAIKADKNTDTEAEA